MKTLEKKNISDKVKNGRNGMQFVYVLDAIKNSSRAQDEGKIFENDYDTLNYLFTIFNAEFNIQQNKRDYPCLQERISLWLAGLPSCIDLAYTWCDITKYGVTWGVLDSEEGHKAEKFVQNWFSVIALRLLQAGKKVGLNPYKYAI